MKDHENTKFIEDITFLQIKMATQAANARLQSFDRQFSGCHKNLNQNISGPKGQDLFNSYLNNRFLGRQKTSTNISNSKEDDYQSFDCIEVIA